MGSNDGTNQNIELENKFVLYLLFTFFFNWICGYILNTKYIIHILQGLSIYNTR